MQSIPFQEVFDTNEQIYAKHENEAIILTIRLKYTQWTIFIVSTGTKCI